MFDADGIKDLFKGRQCTCAYCKETFSAWIPKGGLINNYCSQECMDKAKPPASSRSSDAPSSSGGDSPAATAAAAAGATLGCLGGLGMLAFGPYILLYKAGEKYGWKIVVSSVAAFLAVGLILPRLLLGSQSSRTGTDVEPPANVEPPTRAVAGPIPTTPCGKVRGIWQAEVQADLGEIWGSGKAAKALIVEGRTLKVWALSMPTYASGSGWVAWNTKAPRDEGDTCVFEVRDTVYGEGFGKDSVTPYNTVRQLVLTPADGGVELGMTYDPPVAVKGGPSASQIGAWLKSFDGSFWTDASAELKEELGPSSRMDAPAPSR